MPPALGSAASARSYAAFTDAGVAALVVLVLLEVQLLKQLELLVLLVDQL